MTNRTLIRILWIAGIFLFLGLVLSAVERKRGTDLMNLRVIVEDSLSANFITESDVQLILERYVGHQFDGTPIGNLNPRKVEAVLEKDPFIRDADVFVDARNDINIKVRQSQPIVRVMDTKGNNYYLDAAGEYLPMSANFTARVPVTTGRLPQYYQNYREDKENLLNGLMQMVLYIKDDPFLWAMTEQIYVDGDGEFSIIPKVGSYRIIVGKTDRLEEKLRNLKVFYTEGLPYGDWKKYKNINLKFKGQVVCTKR